MDSPYGAVVGAIVVTALSQWLGDLATSPAIPARVGPALNTLLYGGVIFVVMRFFPDGLLPLLQRAAVLTGRMSRTKVVVRPVPHASERDPQPGGVRLNAPGPSSETVER
jgi:hypothetical protein